VKNPNPKPKEILITIFESFVFVILRMLRPWMDPKIIPSAIYWMSSIRMNPSSQIITRTMAMG